MRRRWKGRPPIYSGADRPAILHNGVGRPPRAFGEQGNGLVVHVTGFDDPETARSLTGKGIWIHSSALPALDSGEIYWHQLEGLKVINQQGQLFGVVTELMETGANDVLVVSPSTDSIDDRQRLIPYLPGKVIEQVDLAEKTIQVNWEADYLE